MRPKQWIKNVFVFAPLVFAGLVTNVDAVLSGVMAFVLFSVAASATYILNDYQDMENDRKHLIKSKSRPLAAGTVSPKQGITLLFGLYGVLAVATFFQPYLMLVILAYLLLNAAYTFYLKHQPVLDIFSIGFGFVLRVYAGAIVLGVPLSSWMFITTLSLALYLASIKRRQELLKSGTEARDVLQYYTPALVEKYAEMSATCAMLFYSLFVITSKPELVYTIIFVMFGLYRYWFVVESQGAGESPTDVVFVDRQLQITILGWLVACGYAVL